MTAGIGTIIVNVAFIVAVFAAFAAMMDTRNKGPGFVLACCLVAIAIGGMMGAR